MYGSSFVREPGDLSRPSGRRLRPPDRVEEGEEPIADDERTGEVETHGRSSCEACEQNRHAGGGAGGAKGRDRGECDPAKHVPDAGGRADASQARDHIRVSCKAQHEGRRSSIRGRRPLRQTPEVGAVCGNPARTDLSGGRSAMDVPTAIEPLTSAVQAPARLTGSSLPFLVGDVGDSWSSIAQRLFQPCVASASTVSPVSTRTIPGCRSAASKRRTITSM